MAEQWDKPRQVRVADPLWDEAGRACRKLRTDRATVMREALEAVIVKASEAPPRGEAMGAALVATAEQQAAEATAETPTCPKCGSKRLRLEVPPDFESFEVCRDCGHILGAPEKWDTPGTKPVRCTASGEERTWPDGAWASVMVACPDCGQHGDLVWVRGTDLSPRAKTRAHKTPPGVTPSAYAVHPRGGVVVAE